MADKNSNIDYELITKYLAGEANSEESYVVTLWLNSSTANQQKFEGLKLLWEQTGHIIAHEPADVAVEDAWKRFQSRVNADSAPAENQPQFASKTRSIYYYISRAAAVLIIGISIYFVYQNRGAKAIEEVQLATSDNMKTDTLPDGSIVALNSFSTLRFPEKFDHVERPVSLKGEAYFEVAPNTEKPFHVKVEGATISVLGTAFYVQAYDTLATITVGVKEGSVRVSTAGSEVILKAGESIAIDKKTKKVDQVAAYNPNAIYWKTQTLIFQNERLENVFESLETYYKVNITPENQKILDCRLTAKFYGESVEQIFEIINTNFYLTSSKIDDQIIISGSGCE